MGTFKSIMHLSIMSSHMPSIMLLLTSVESAGLDLCGLNALIRASFFIRTVVVGFCSEARPMIRIGFIVQRGNSQICKRLHLVPQHTLILHLPMTTIVGAFKL
jgi:hypothetical protein